MSDGVSSTVSATLRISSPALTWKGANRRSETQARQWLADHLKSLTIPEPLARRRASNALHNYRDYHTVVVNRCTLEFSIEGITYVYTKF